MAAIVITAPDDRIFHSAWRILTEFAALHPELEPQPLWQVTAMGGLRRHILVFRIGGEGAAYSYFQGDATPENRISCVLSKDGAEAGRIELNLAEDPEQILEPWLRALLELDSQSSVEDALSFLPLDDQVLETARLHLHAFAAGHPQYHAEVSLAVFSTGSRQSRRLIVQPLEPAAPSFSFAQYLTRGQRTRTCALIGSLGRISQADFVYGAASEPIAENLTQWLSSQLRSLQ